MDYQHEELSKGGWGRLSLLEQLGNVGSEVERAEIWRGRDEKLFNGAMRRAFELLDLTIQDSRWGKGIKELTRAREVLADSILEEHKYNISLKDMEEYFFHFALAARRNR